MPRPDVVHYLRENLQKFDLEDLRHQLKEEGVSDSEFDECLAAAKLAPKEKPDAKMARLLTGAGVAVIVAIVLITFFQKPSSTPYGSEGQNAQGESAFVGHDGWVVRLPKDYVGVSEFKNASKSDQLIHFCKRDTDPTNFLNEGLFGQMGIIRLEVVPSPFPSSPAGIASLSSAVSQKTSSRGEKFTSKLISVAGLQGVQLNIQSPFPRVEAYVLGQKDLYFFYAGQEDDVWRDIVLSLRDAHSEN